MSELSSFLSTTGRTLTQMALYSPEHPMVKDAIGESHRLLTIILSDTPELALSISEGKLLANGKPPEAVTDATLRPFVQLLNMFDLHSLSFHDGIREAELIPFFLLAYRSDLKKTKPDINEFFSSKHVAHIRVNQAKYTKIGENETVGLSGTEKSGPTSDSDFLKELEDVPLDNFLQRLIARAVADPTDQGELFRRVSSLIKKEIEKAVERETKVLKVQRTQAVNERERTESVVETMADGVVVVDETGRVLMMNSSAEQIYGVSLGECLGKPLWEGVQQEQMVSLAKDLIIPTDRGIVREVEVKAAEDTRKTLRASTATVQDPDGRVVGMISVLSDVTKQKELTRLQNEFMANVTHDLRSPIHAVKLAVEAILENAAGPVTPEQKRMLTLATRNVDRLARLIDNLLDFEQMETGKFKIHAQVISLGPLLNESVASLDAWAKSRNVGLAYDEVESLATVYADPDRMLQVVNNLLSNAIKFTPAGGRVVLRAKNLDEAGKKRVRVEVEDNGKGISREDQKRIFQRFVQLENNQKLDVRGTGLGLSICRGIIQQHSSELVVESPPANKKNGSLFWFTIPAIEKGETPQIEKPTAITSEQRSGFWKRIFKKFKLSLFLLLLLPGLAGARPYWGKVRRVMSGDRLQLEDGSVVRYLGIDLPALGTAYHAEAVAASQGWVLNKEVRFKYGLQERDAQGNFQAYVFIDGVFVNAALVEEGWALVARLSNDEEFISDLIKAEKKALKGKRGVWKDSAIDPYAIRMQKKGAPYATKEEIKQGFK